MDALQIVWLLIAIAAMQPILRQRWLLAARQKLIAKLERERGSRVILLVHRQETMSLLGFPVMRYIDIDDSEAVIDAINRTDPDVPVPPVPGPPRDQRAGVFAICEPHLTLGERRERRR